MSPPALRPLRVGEILDAGIKVYLRNARVLMGLTAVVVIPLQVISGVILLSTVSSDSEVPGSFPRFTVSKTGSGTTQHINSTAFGSSLILAILGALAGLLTTAACVKAVSDSYLDQPTDIRSSLRFALRRLGSVLWLEILVAIGLGLAFVALILPSIWLYGTWAVATPALLIEGKHGSQALRRSFRLVRKRWWPTAGLLLLSTLMSSIVGGAFSAALLAVSLTGGSHAVLLTVTVSSLAGAASAILTRPFHATVATILYYDLRVRHEGYDVELLAEQLGIEPAKLPIGEVSDMGPESVGQPGGPPFWPPPPGWRPAQVDVEHG